MGQGTQALAGTWQEQFFLFNFLFEYGNQNDARPQLQFVVERFFFCAQTRRGEGRAHTTVIFFFGGGRCMSHHSTLADERERKKQNIRQDQSGGLLSHFALFLSFSYFLSHKLLCWMD